MTGMFIHLSLGYVNNSNLLESILNYLLMKLFIDSFIHGGLQHYIHLYNFSIIEIGDMDILLYA